MEGEGDWAAKKEIIDGSKTIVFFKKGKTSSPLQALRDKKDKIMSGTAAANKYLKKMQINQKYKILENLQDPNKNKISKESLNSYIQNLHSITKINGELSGRIENISNIEKWENNFVSVCEIISFKSSENSEKVLNLINSLIENRRRSDFQSTDKKNTIASFNAKPIDAITKNNNEFLISSDEKKISSGM
jgi:acetolactate synthase small subunit